MIREIVTYDIDKKDNPEVLTSKTREVSDFKSQEVIDCVQDLNDTLDELIRTEGNKRGAIGLSATQIGVDLAISAVTLGDKRYMLINPKLEEENGNERLFRIGCFSLYKYRAMVRYNDDVIISYYDPDGNRQTLELKGDRSCVVQHEMDHLVGDLLFERLEHKKEDLFIPREALYKDGKVPLNNHGLIFELERKHGLRKAVPVTVWYSSLFNDYTDYVAYVDKTAAQEKELLDIIKKYAPANGKITEAGCGTGALSVSLNKDGYTTRCCESDQDMLELAIRIGEANSSDTAYNKGNITDLPYEDKSSDLIFSYEVLETLDEQNLVKALKEGLRVADTYVFKVPTIRISANTLKGNERLRTERTWKKTIARNGFTLLESRTMDNDGYLILVIK